MGITNTHSFWDVASRQYEEGYDDGDLGGNLKEEKDYRFSVGNCAGGWRIILEEDLQTLYYYNHKTFDTYDDAKEGVKKMRNKVSKYTELDYSYWTHLVSVEESWDAH